MDIEQVIRRWAAGDGIRLIGRATGLDRNTVRRLIRLAQAQGLRVGETIGDEHIEAIRKQMGRPGAPVQTSAGQQLRPQRERIQRWLAEDKLVLTKVHELLEREGVSVSYATLYRFARKFCGLTATSAIAVRRQESKPGEVA